jgi:hypothetical protein
VPKRISMFDPSFKKSELVHLFHPDHPQILTNKFRRWGKFMARARTGTLFERPVYIPEFGATYQRYQRPMFHVLQAKYEDLEYEVNEIRKSSFATNSLVVFIGMDGLGIMRMNHTLAAKSYQYLFTAPAVVPVLGEYPHGAYHLLHCDWRLWWEFLEKMERAVFVEPAVKAEPKVSDFKLYDQAYKVITRACSEYVLEMCDDSDGVLLIKNPNSLIKDVGENGNSETVCYFLYNSGFPYLQMRESVGCNKAEDIDLVWREKLPSMRSPSRTAESAGSDAHNQSARQCQQECWLGHAL